MIFQPIDASMLNAALEVFRKVSSLATGFVSLIFVARISLLVASVASVDAYGKLLRDIAFYFIAISLFPQVFKIVVSSVGTLSAQVGSQVVASGGGLTATDELMNAMKAQMPILGFLIDILPLSITYIAAEYLLNHHRSFMCNCSSDVSFPPDLRKPRWAYPVFFDSNYSMPMACPLECFRSTSS